MNPEVTENTKPKYEKKKAKLEPTGHKAPKLTDLFSFKAPEKEDPYADIDTLCEQLVKMGAYSEEGVKEIRKNMRKQQAETNRLKAKVFAHKKKKRKLARKARKKNRA